MPRTQRSGSLPTLPRFLVACALIPLFIGVLVAGTADPDGASKVDPWVFKHTAHGEACEFLVILAAQADLTGAEAFATKVEKGSYVFAALTETAQSTQGPILAWLGDHRIEHRSFTIVNMIWVRAGRDVVDALAARKDVRKIEGNPRLSGMVGDASSTAPFAPATLRAVEPGIAYTNAPLVWGLGFTGQGIVLGGQDTGYMWNHPALINHYRGWNGTTASHDYNWHDSIHSGGGSCGADSPTPCDDNNHGTHTMGTAIGDDGASNQIGMAPGARWIGSRNMDQGNGTPATYIESFQFFLAPYPVGGTTAQGNPALAPDVTTNSWLCPPSEGCSLTSLLAAVQAHRAAGIMNIFAAGNSGSGCSTVNWAPAIYDEVTSVGALNNGTDNIAGFSSRGPVTVDGSNRMKPDITAPGTGVRSSVNGGGYAGGYSGTSMATPHVAGAVALLWSAHPALKNDIPATENVLQDTAVHLSSTSCSSAGTPNNVFGHGRLDVLAAVNAVRSVTLLPASTTNSGALGSSVILNLTVTNTGYIADTFNVQVAGGTFATTATPSPVGPIAAGATALVQVTVQVPSGTGIGQNSSATVTVTSQNWAAATASASLTTTATPVVPTLALAQPSGPATGTFVNNGNLLAGHEYFNVFSGDLCAPVGSGIWLGLCALDPAPLFAQVTFPVGTIPFHFQAAGLTTNFGPFTLAPGITLDGVCFDATGGSLLGVSSVTRYTTQ